MVFGDPIGGAVRGLFGTGVLDVKLPARVFTFLHTAYWDQPQTAEPWLRALRRAVNLKRLDDDALWLEQATADEIAGGALPTP